MAKHSASVIVRAPADQVYRLFSHFNDFPKFMTCIREVTYYDDERSHWVADILGHHEWDAINTDWTENRQIGWRSIDGLENSGRVIFDDLGGGRTRVSVMIEYDPPAGVLGDAAEILAAGREFEACLTTDLENFARMVDAAPPGALDPNSSDYLFHTGSAAAQGTTTPAQDASMEPAPEIRKAA